jgi:hypothetical protein
MDGYCLRLIDVSICWVAAEADTQFTIFDSPALKKQCLSAPSKLGVSLTLQIEEG